MPWLQEAEGQGKGEDTDEKVQIFSCKVSSKEQIHSMVTTVNNNVLYP